MGNEDPGQALKTLVFEALPGALLSCYHGAEVATDGTIVVILPDRGDRYLSTNLFRSQCADCPPLTGWQHFTAE